MKVHLNQELKNGFELKAVKSSGTVIRHCLGIFPKRTGQVLGFVASLSLQLMLRTPHAWAQEASSAATPAETFHRLFFDALPEAARTQPDARYLHFLPDQNLLNAEQAASIQDAIAYTRGSSVESLAKATEAKKLEPVLAGEVNNVLRRHPLTMVIVPGIFGEFIQVRPFEEILGRNSKFKNDFVGLVQKRKAAHDANAIDLGYSSEEAGDVAFGLDELVHVGTIDDRDGQPLVRVALLYPRFMSLETLGDSAERAKLFNRRLAKYLALTGQQDLVLVGYSRGSTFALDMLAQAKKENAPWLKNVKGVVSLAGVVWGSTSADQTKDLRLQTSQGLEAMRVYSKSLQTRPPSLFGLPSALKANYDADVRVAQSLAKIAGAPAPQPLTSESGVVALPGQDSQFETYMQLDAVGPFSLFSQGLGNLGYKNPLNYWGRVERRKVAIDAALMGIDQLRTDVRIDWWKKHTLPSHVTYYTISAAMANPNGSGFERSASQGALSYTPNSVEDNMLWKNWAGYVQGSGLMLNDSQVAIPQTMFLPNFVSRLNPEQEPLKTQFLGVMGTHHWGMALKVVFPMRDGRTNPVPREALMKALAAKVAFDLDQGSVAGDAGNQKAH
jgi:pimeloyl-ACP methyl ester carboxylesterase